VHEGLGLVLGHLHAQNPLYAFLQCIDTELLDPDTLDPHDLVCIIDVDQQNRPAGDELNSPGRLLVGEGEIDDVSAPNRKE